MAHAGGRPTKMNDELLAKAGLYLGGSVRDDSGELAAIEPIYVQVGDVVPTIEGFGLYLGISRETVYQWEKDNTEFSDITSAIRQQQSQLLINGALGNKFNATISKLLLSSKHGYVEKTETDITTKGEAITPDTRLAEEFAAYLKNK